MIVLVFDHRHLGASDGDDRGRIVFQEQHDDLAAASWIAQQPGVDTDRIGLWARLTRRARAVPRGA
jgi:hypothetical protein